MQTHIYTGLSKAFGWAVLSWKKTEACHSSQNYCSTAFLFKSPHPLPAPTTLRPPLWKMQHAAQGCATNHPPVKCPVKVTAGAAPPQVVPDLEQSSFGLVNLVTVRKCYAFSRNPWVWRRGYKGLSSDVYITLRSQVLLYLQSGRRGNGHR